VEVSGVRMSESVLALLDQLAREWRVPRDEVLLKMLDIAGKKGLGEITRGDVRAHVEQLRPSSAATTPRTTGG
jgi:hypothetical protein